MKELLETFSLGEIVIFLVLLAATIKSFFTFWDWAVGRLKLVFNKQYEKEQLKEKFQEIIADQNRKLNSAFQEHNQMRDQMGEIHQMINVLMESDRNDIKAWITEKHHYFCYEKGYIDDYSLDCLERRFASYEKEDGNSFVETLMNEIRALPKVSKAEKK